MTNTDKIETSLHLLETLALEQAKQVHLEDRIDHKFVFSADLLPSIIYACQQHYKVIVFGEKRWSQYLNLYFDTDDLLFYHQHHAGKLNRFKIRIRTYVESGEHFLEIKSRTNKNRTQKERIQINSDRIDNAGEEFIYARTGYHSSDLNPIILITYKRITLLNKERNERVTIDLDLAFSSAGREKKLENVAIAEIKQNKQGSSYLKNILHLHHINEGSLSKYCLGINFMMPDVKQNLFKAQNLLIKKIAEYGE